MACCNGMANEAAVALANEVRIRPAEFTGQSRDDIGERVEGGDSDQGFATPKAWQIECDDFANFPKRIHRVDPLRQV